MRTALGGLLLSLVLAAPAVADPASTPTPLWIPNGEVSDVLLSGTTAFVGGRFTRVGPYTGALARVDRGAGTLREGWPEVAGSVVDVISDGDGGWYLGGDFFAVGELPRANLAHIRADGTVDAAFAPSTDGTVWALQLVGGVVYAGGSFGQANGEPHSRLAAFDAASGESVAFNGNVTGISGSSVNALVVGGTKDSPVLYAGGSFGGAVSGGTAFVRNDVAAFSLPDGDLQAFDANVTGSVHALLLTADRLYVGGEFSKVGAADRRNLAAVSPVNGSVDSFNHAVGSGSGESVHALALSGSTLYAGGLFFGSTANLRAIDVTTGQATAFNAKLSIFSAVQALAVRDGTLYAGGMLYSVGGSTVRENAAAFDAVTGAATAWDPRAGGSVTALAVTADEVVIGGQFATAGGVARENLAAIDLGTGRPTGFATGVDGLVRAIAESNGTLFVTGPFQNAGGVPRLGTAAMDTATGALTTFAPEFGVNVYDLLAKDSIVYAGGHFTEANGAPRANLAAVRHVPGTSGALLPFRADIGGDVHALELVGDTLYAGGTFPAPRANLAAVDAETGALRAFDAGLGDAVYALTGAGATIVAGGMFTSPRSRLGAFDASGAPAAFAAGTDAMVTALDTLDGVAYVGGTFKTIGTAARWGLAAVDQNTGVASPWNPHAAFTKDFAGRVSSISATPEGGILVGGLFHLTGPGTRAAHLVAFPVPPRAPAVTGAQAGDGQATVSFTAPATGGAQITSYTATATPGGATATGSGSPLTVGGLTNGTAYTLRVTATNRAGTSGPSEPAGPVIPAAGAGSSRAPEITEFSASRRRLRAGKKRTPASGTARPAAKRPGRGTTLTLGLSAAATVRFDMLAETKGRRAGGKCRKPTRANRRGKRCVRLVRRGTFRRTAPAGRSRVVFTARLGKRPVKPGRYRLRATPSDAVGRVGAARDVRLRVVR